MKQENFFSKYAKVSFIMSLLVVGIHTSTLYFYNLDQTIILNHFITQFIIYIRDYVALVAVPCFFVLSGAMMFRNLTWENMLIKLKKRFFSLVIPYLFWNLVAFLFDWILFSVPVFSQYIAMREFSLPSNFFEFIYNIIFYKYNYFLWFIFVLILYFILTPIWYLVLKYKRFAVVGLLIIVIVMPYAGFYLSYLPYYVLGAYLGRYYFDLLADSKNKLAIILGGIAFLGLTLYSMLIDNSFMNTAILKTLYLIVLVVSFWLAMDFLRYRKAKWWTNASFVIYASQVIVSSSVCKLLFIALPNNWLFAFINFFGTLVLTAILCAVMNLFLNKWVKPLYNIMNGFREL